MQQPSLNGAQHSGNGADHYSGGSTDGQPPIKWKSIYQRHIIENVVAGARHHGDYERMYKRWKSSIAKGKRYVGTIEEIIAEQVFLDNELCSLERQQMTILNGHKAKEHEASKLEEQKIAEAFVKMGIIQRLYCHYLGWSGHYRKDQIRIVTGHDYSARKPNDSAEDDWSTKYGPDYEPLHQQMNKIKDRLRILHWDFVFYCELHDERLRNREKEERLALIKKARHEAMLKEAEKLFYGAGSREVPHEIRRFLIREKDYKRGNRLDNYVRKHLTKEILQAFGDACIVCKCSERLVLDHWKVPKNEGGNFLLYDVKTESIVLNVAALCVSCNSSKGERRPRQWMTDEQIRQVEAAQSTLWETLRRDLGLRKTLKMWYDIDLFKLFLLESKE